MIKKGWLPPGNSMESRTADLLAFFSLSNHVAWEDYYLKQQLKVAFRISLAHTKDAKDGVKRLVLYWNMTTGSERAKYE